MKLIPKSEERKGTEFNPYQLPEVVVEELSNWARTHLIGKYIKYHDGTWRRINSDGTLTKVWDGSEGSLHFNTVPDQEIRNQIAMEYQKQLHKGQIKPFAFNGVGLTYPESFEWNVLLRNSGGYNDMDLGREALYIIRNMAHNLGLGDHEYYSGVIGTNEGDLIGPKVKKGNYVNAFTHQDFTGFKPSTVGIGHYKDNEKYNTLPAVEGNFYGNAVYLPTDDEQIFKNNSGRWGYLNKDNVIKIPGTYDAGNHRIELEYNNNTPTVLFEDVFNTNNKLVDKHNYPFIVNQRIPVIFTDDKDKLGSTLDLRWAIENMLNSPEKNGYQFTE